MKNILILSDTHSYYDEKLTKYILQSDEVWHGGDIGSLEVTDAISKLKPLKAVWGNIDDTDARMTFEENLIFQCEEIKVFITHIGGYPGKYSKGAREIITKEKPGLFVCGHSHILKVMFDKKNDLLHINPGAAGIHGFHKVKTAVRLTIDGKEMKNLEIIELGPRTS